MYDYKIIERCVDTDDKHIYGKLVLPETSAEKYPLIIFAHEHNCRWTRGVKYGKALAPYGFAVYGFDFCGNTMDSSSSGKMWEVSVVTNAEDLADIYRAAQEWPEIDTDRIYFMGASQGGFACALCVERLLPEVPKMVLLYPGFPMPDSLCSQFSSLEEIPEKLERKGDKPYYVGKKYFADIWGYDAYSECWKYTNPVLILQGQADTWVLPRSSIKAAEAYPNAEIKLYEGAPHIFQGRYMEQAVKDTVEFLKV